jgi:hypothetical protein
MSGYVYVSGAYTYTLNLCDEVVDGCPDSGVVCQYSTNSDADYALGSRFTEIIMPGISSSTVLVVNYTDGTYCGVIGAPRQVLIYFNCTAQAANNITVVENTTCHYLVYIQVPLALCQPYVPTAAPTRPAITTGTGTGDYCSGGYLSPTNRLWTFQNLVGSATITDGGTIYLFVLNICDTNATNCVENSVLCQQSDSTTEGYSLGARYAVNYLNTSTDTMLALHFGSGDLCGSLGPRETLMYLSCNDTQYFQLNETTECRYTLTANVPTAFCQALGGSSNSVKAVVIAAPVVIGTVTVAAAAAAVVLYRKRLLKPFAYKQDQKL